ncbi:MAG: hypothetical protein HY092_01525, partial [Candidatus Kerfeldbacteria bacterium]|nr:hypothetical protein [Candidatus Kerfeldbacteria bacterium]
TTAGSFGYMVHYNGDGTYNPSTGICEPFSVSNPLVTRTLGFWQTHTDFTWKVFTTQLGGSMPIGTAPHKGFITTKAQLFGGFYASIPYKTDGSKRNPIDKARIQLLQQLIAAKLNCAAFGCTASVMAMITNADNAYANGPASAILAAASQLDAYNNSGDGGTIPASLGDPGSATPDASQAVANLAYWDNP